MLFHRYSFGSPFISGLRTLKTQNATRGLACGNTKPASRFAPSHAWNIAHKEPGPTYGRRQTQSRTSNKTNRLYCLLPFLTSLTGPDQTIPRATTGRGERATDKLDIRLVNRLFAIERIRCDRHLRSTRVFPYRWRQRQRLRDYWFVTEGRIRISRPVPI